ncbi:MAG: hypothetical protein BWY52_01868 [Chloroflexi bacterium ADurb.Bin325]|nr:MAG: hypothetical protein BWY52_01868 [Chloroflexi bacterium ADurb.Bin325]
MTVLVLALYAEGHTDESFLPVVIQRTAEEILARHGRTVVDVLEPINLNHGIDRQFETREERMIEAARRASGYHALIVHADADYPTQVRALNERYLPGEERVRELREIGESLCGNLIPIIPIQMTEAWMLADPIALCNVIGVQALPQALGIPVHPHQVESDTNPKRTLHEVLERALTQRPRRRRRVNLSSIYEPLARQIDLARLAGVPAYARFLSDLTTTFRVLGLAS